MLTLWPEDMIPSDYYKVKTRNRWTGCTGKMIGFTPTQMATLDFGTESSHFMTKSLMWVCSGEVEDESEIPMQVPRQQESPVRVHTGNVEGRTRVGELVADATDELCRAFKRTLRIELDVQRE